jgi:N-methylhydantoinase A
MRGGGAGREPWDGIDVEAIETAFRDLDAGCVALLDENGIDAGQIDLTQTVDVRYRRQTNELLVAWEPAASNGRPPIEDLVDRFERAYEDAFGRGAGFREAGTEITTLRVQARGRTVKPQLRPDDRAGAAEPVAGEREVYEPAAGEVLPVPVWQWGDLPAGFRLAGPALIDHPTTTIFIGAAQRVELDPHRNLVIATEEER